MGDIHRAPPLALTLRGYIQHAPERWRAHMAAAADQVEEVARLRADLAAARALLDARPKQWWLPWEPQEVARRFHLAYETFAPDFGYETRPDTKVFDPYSPNGQLMIAVVRCVLIEQAQDAALAATGRAGIASLYASPRRCPARYCCRAVAGYRRRGGRAMTPQELQSLRNLGGECETAADEIDRLRADVTAVRVERDEARLLFNKEFNEANDSRRRLNATITELQTDLAAAQADAARWRRALASYNAGVIMSSREPHEGVTGYLTEFVRANEEAAALAKEKA